jgi:hypothetical protein
VSSGAFRDASAAVERAAALEDENRALSDELAALRAEVEALKAPDNAAAYLARVQDERDELLREVKELREALGVVAPGKGGPTPLSRLKAQLAAERQENTGRRNEHSAQLAALAKERDQARSEVARQAGQIAWYEARLKQAIAERPPEEQHEAVAGLAPGETLNRDAYVQRLQEERDELLEEVRRLRTRKR